jgi:spermidine synthase
VGAGALSLLAYGAIDSTPAWVEALGAKGNLRLLSDAAICAAILLPGTLCIGATFPLAVRILARSQNDAGPDSARVYAWNTVGSIAGAVGAGFFLIPAVGFAWTITIAVAANASLALATALRARPRPRANLFAALAVIALLALVRPSPPWQLLRVGALTSRLKAAEIVYFGVGRGATVMLQRAPGGWQVSSNGLAEAMINEPGVRVGRFVMVRWLSNLPAWGRPDARSILVVGFGGGLVVEAVPANFERIDVVEIEPEMIRANEMIANARREDPLSDPRLEVIINDARSALMLTDERYDAIVSQPSHPWTASASHLYTREFFELVKDHLSEDGVFVQWMGLGFVDEALLASLVATLQDVFPHVRVYRPSTGGFLFSASTAAFEPERLVDVAIRRNPQAAAELGIHGGEDVVAHMVLDEEGARAFARGAPVSTDDRNLLQMNSPGIVRTPGRFDPAPVLASFDPLQRGSLQWKRSYLIRRTLATGLTARARRLANAATDPAAKQVGLGLIARHAGDRPASLGHFRRALEAQPDNAEAQLALLQLLHASGDSGEALLRRLEYDPVPSAQLLAESWELERNDQWQALRERETELAALGPHDPAFQSAIRLRALWRLQMGGAENAREALRLLDSMLPVGGSLADLVLRARAAGRVGYGTGATSSLFEVLRKTDRHPSHRPALREALRVLDELPSDLISDGRRRALRTQLLAKLRKN